MDIDDIDYKTLRRIQQLEKTTPVLSKIPEMFYQKLTVYIENLEQRALQEKDSQKLKLFHDEIENTKKLVHDIYELREKKIVQSALSKVRGGTPDLKNVHPLEQQLFDILIKQINLARTKIFTTKPEKTPLLPSSKPKPTHDPSSNTHPILHIKETLPEFVGTNMKTYALRKDDVLSLPQDISAPLLKRGVANQIK
jgi:DNA replication initiation complex subunit (GINS family)